jgi:hypothetical protein
MIVLPLLIAAGLGFTVRPARRAHAVVGLLVVLLTAVLWLTVAHDDGEAPAFFASMAGLWAVSTVIAAGGAWLAARRGR